MRGPLAARALQSRNASHLISFRLPLRHSLTRLPVQLSETDARILPLGSGTHAEGFRRGQHLGLHIAHSPRRRRTGARRRPGADGPHRHPPALPGRPLHRVRHRLHRPRPERRRRDDPRRGARADRYPALGQHRRRLRGPLEHLRRLQGRPERQALLRPHLRRALLGRHPIRGRGLHQRCLRPQHTALRRQQGRPEDLPDHRRPRLRRHPERQALRRVARATARGRGGGLLRRRLLGQGGQQVGLRLPARRSLRAPRDRAPGGADLPLGDQVRPRHRGVRPPRPATRTPRPTSTRRNRSPSTSRPASRRRRSSSATSAGSTGRSSRSARRSTSRPPPTCSASRARSSPTPTTGGPTTSASAASSPTRSPARSRSPGSPTSAAR